MPDSTPTKPARIARCPSCGEPAVHEHRPFCSRRCADLDLARWLGGRYVIPGPEHALDGETVLSPDQTACASRGADVEER
jgi:hypothetical protein